MRVAILSESQADEAAVRILTEGILGRPTQRVDFPPPRTRGWPAVLRVLPPVLQHLHYRTNAEALVIVVDANHSPIYQSAHEHPGMVDLQCRLCQLRQIVTQTQNSLQPVVGQALVKTAIGVAVPAIEAWYRYEDPHISEAAWVRNRQAGTYWHIKNRLKQDIYGTDRPSLSLETQCASEAARRLVQNLAILEALFPGGFGPLVRDVRNWLAS
jgi:hypothetical protein